MIFQLLGLRLPLLSGSFTATSPSRSSLNNQSDSILTNWDSTFWTNHTVKIWSLYLLENNQSGTRMRDFYLCKSAPLWLEEHPFTSHQRLKRVSLARDETPKTQHWRCLPVTQWSGAKKGRVKQAQNRPAQQRGTEQIDQSQTALPRWRAAFPQGCLFLELPLHSHAVSQPFCYHNWAVWTE